MAITSVTEAVNWAITNPFREKSTLRFALPETDFVSLRVFNSLGSEVAVLFEAQADAGKAYTVDLDALGKFTAGNYIARLTTAGGEALIQKLVVGE